MAALDHLADSVAPGDARFKFRLISKEALERRRKSATKRLTSEEGDRLARLVKVFSSELMGKLESLKKRQSTMFKWRWNCHSDFRHTAEQRQ